MLCAALGVPRSEAANAWLPKLGTLRMGVRIDLPGVRWWDYHTVGAGMKMRIAESEGKTKPGAMLTRREYLCDASFLVALQGEPSLIAELEAAMKAPRWTLYLGRKSCIPSRPLLEHPKGDFPDLLSALRSISWRHRLKGDQQPLAVECLLDWNSTSEQSNAPDDALIWYDVPVTFEPPSHQARFLVRRQLRVGADGEVSIDENPAQKDTPAPRPARPDYHNTEFKERRRKRLEEDHHLCVFCKSPATTAHHITYRRAGGNETHDDLRSLCRLCHDAVTMTEYGLGMGMDRINPEDPRWRSLIVSKRDEIIKFRSLENRRRRLAAEEVE
jgi:CRISPR system Cascade subunit CasD